jgi:cyanophycin synthetase
MISLLKKPIAIKGYVYGLKYPSLRLVCKIETQTDLAKKIRAFNDFMLNEIKLVNEEAVLFDIKNGEENFENITHPFEIIYIWIKKIYGASQWPIFQENCFILQDTKNGQDVFKIFIPTFQLGHQSTLKIVDILIKVFNHISLKDHSLNISKDLLSIIKNNMSFISMGSNTPRFLKAAYDLNIPWEEYPGNLVQYGYGKYLKILDSSFTDRTPLISATLSRNKVLTSNALRQAGLPVSHQLIVGSIQGAIKAANDIGYPVVLKPIDRDGGLGVFTNLFSDDAVMKAYQNACKHSKNIVIEKHYISKDYRLITLHNKLIWAIERVPAGVIGDGLKSIKELVDTLNSDHRRNKLKSSLLKMIELDEEALDLLIQQKYTAESVPNKNDFVQLRRAANISRGGMPVEVFHDVHPDNKELALRAARLLKLDLAGIDLLIPDIKKSWLESGALICEVNGQPQLGGITSPHIYGEILEKIIPRKGRIPVIVIMGSRVKQDDPVTKEILSYFKEKSLCIGTASVHEVVINEKIVTKKSLDIFSASKVISVDDEVDVAIILIDDLSILSHGLAFQYIDLLIINDSINEIAPDHLPSLQQDALIQESIHMLAKHCHGEILYLENISTAKENKRIQDLLVPLIKNIKFIETENLKKKIDSFYNILISNDLSYSNKAL